MNNNLSAQGGPARGGKIASIIIVLVAIGIAGWFLVGKKSQRSADLTQKNVEVENNNKQEIVKNGQEQGQSEKEGQNEIVNNKDNNQQNIEELEVADIDTSNWKEYCNEEYGFCVKYPEGWGVDFGDYRDRGFSAVDIIPKKYNFYANNKISCGVFITIEEQPQGVHRVEDLLTVVNNDTNKKYIREEKFTKAKHKIINGHQFIISDIYPNFLDAVAINIFKNKYYVIESGDDTGERIISEECRKIYYTVLASFKMIIH